MLQTRPLRLSTVGRPPRLLDDSELFVGVAMRKCCKFRLEHLMGDSADDVDEADTDRHECLGGEAVFPITAGVYRYRDQDGSLSNDVRWLYIGCRRPACELVGCYADWKCEYDGYRKLLALM